MGLCCRRVELDPDQDDVNHATASAQVVPWGAAVPGSAFSVDRLELLLPQDSPVLAYATSRDINNVVLMTDLTPPVWELFTWYFHSAESLTVDDVGAEQIGVLNNFELRGGIEKCDSCRGRRAACFCHALQPILAGVAAHVFKHNDALGPWRPLAST